MQTTRIKILMAMLLALAGCQRESPPGEVKTEQPTLLAPEPAKDEPTSASDSRLRVETWEFGIIRPGTELRHRYTIQNDTNRIWTIKHVTPSCTCTCGEFTSRIIKPSESTSVEVILRAPERDGDVYQAVMVEFAEADAPFIQLAMKGEIRGLLSPSPSTVDFGRVWETKHLSRSIQLRNFSEQDVAITRIEGPEWLRADALSMGKTQASCPARQTWKITVHADLSKFKAGEEPALVVHTNSSNIGPVVIPVRLEIKPPLEVIPSGLDFRTVPIGGTSQRAVMLNVSPELGNVSETDLVLTHNLGEELELQVSKTATQNRFRLTGIFRPKRSTGAVHAELEIMLQPKTVPPVRVPVSALVR